MEVGIVGPLIKMDRTRLGKKILKAIWKLNEKWEGPT
jgi:hypothetical protein